MKRVVNVGIGGKSFVMDNDAYAKLGKYLDKFKNGAGMGMQSKEVMDDLEGRIAELFTDSLGAYKEVVDIELVNRVISQLGMPNGEPFVDTDDEQSGGASGNPLNTPRKLYRDPQNKSIGGVCAGLAIYLNLDIALVRVIFVVCFFMGSASFWVYIILWIVAPLAKTASQKCEMYGLPVTAENIKIFSSSK